MSIAGPEGWCEDATTVARLERGEVDAADASPPPFFASHDWWKLCRSRHNYLMIPSTASAFSLPAKGALLALLLALGGCGGGAGGQGGAPARPRERGGEEGQRPGPKRARKFPPVQPPGPPGESGFP